MYYNPRKLLKGKLFPKGSKYVYPLLPFFNLSTPLKHSALLMRGGKIHLLCWFCDPKTFIDSNCTLPNIPIEGHHLVETLLKRREING